jgi:hypothetical protein
MDNEGKDYWFGTPPLLVRRLSVATIENAVRALLSEGDGSWLEAYGALQSGLKND